MTRLAPLAAIVLAALSLNACCPAGEQASGNVTSAAECSAPFAGATVGECKADADEVEAIEAFRAHAVMSSSATAGASRFASGVLMGAGECFARAVGTVMADVLVGAITGRTEATPITCDDVYAGSTDYTFDNGVYTFAARQRSGSPESPWRMDTHATTRLKVFAARDAGSFKRGDLVLVDVKNVDNFLVNARVVINAQGKAVIAYDELGPLAGFLGIDASSPNPIPAATSMRDALASAFEIEGTVHTDMQDCAGKYHSIIDQTIERTPATGELKPVLASATTKSLYGAEVVATEWNTSYKGSIASGFIAVKTVRPGSGLSRARIDLDDADGVSATLTLVCTP